MRPKCSRLAHGKLAQKNHYLPVFYLKQWCSSRDGLLCEYSRPHKKVSPRRVHPSGTGYERGLYTFSGLPPAISDFLEQQFLLRADDGAYRALCSMISGSIDLDLVARSAWSRFIMTLLYRNPQAVARIKEKIVDLLEAHLREYWNENITAQTDKNFRTYEEFRSGFTTNVQGVILKTMHSVMDSERVGEFLNRMVWAVITIEYPKFPMLTSDRPLIMTNGLSDPRAHILMPISPNRVFVAAKTQETLRSIENIAAQSKFVETINDRVASQARKYVYGTDDTQLRFVANRLGKEIPSTPLDQLSAWSHP
jgi:uncharacterized protein DUF4238